MTKLKIHVDSLKLNIKKLKSKILNTIDVGENNPWKTENTKDYSLDIQWKTF